MKPPRPTPAALMLVLASLSAAAGRMQALAQTPAQSVPLESRRGAANSFDRVRFFPAPGRERAMLGGQFAGSNVSARSGFVPLAEIQAVPAPGQWTELAVANDRPFRWIRYEAPPGSHGNVAELEFYLGKKKAAGARFGSFGWRGGRNWPRAADGKTDTWFDSDVADGQYVGVDVGEAATAQSPRMEPPPAEGAGPLKVTLTCNTPGAVIRYARGGVPGPNDGLPYTEPIAIEHTTTLFAVAYKDGLAPSPAAYGTYFVGERVKPGLSTFHVGNSLTSSTARLGVAVHGAGYAHEYKNFTVAGGNTKLIWTNIGSKNKDDWEKALAAIPRIDHFSVQPRLARFGSADLAEEARYDLLMFDAIRVRYPQAQPWFYAEWPPARKPDPPGTGWAPIVVGPEQTVPALTFEEASAALLACVEEAQRSVLETCKDGRRPRVLPCALAVGWLRNALDNGKVPGLSAADFDPVMYADNVHPGDEGRYLINLTWFAAFYGQSPVGRVPPVGTTLSAEQAAFMQRLAWDVVKNYPDCGLYEEGTEPVGAPQFSSKEPISDDVIAVTLTSTTPGAWFRYTLDGTTPTRTRGYVYCGVVSARSGMRLKAVAYKSGMADSPVVETLYARQSFGGTNLSPPAVPR